MASEQIRRDFIGGYWFVHRYNIQQSTISVKVLLLTIYHFCLCICWLYLSVSLPPFTIHHYAVTTNGGQKLLLIVQIRVSTLRIGKDWPESHLKLQHREDFPLSVWVAAVNLRWSRKKQVSQGSVVSKTNLAVNSIGFPVVYLMKATTVRLGNLKDQQIVLLTC